ncbi:Mu DNA-binding protein [Volucribacter psittacicida]|uniref:Mu DNA-binding protein n=1 Tax=Volucribacter psittacicida TaxID=203482 RepID=A0A4R1FQV3_9PAST|nr:DNA-binding protein [Volucribacter psittacicida]TCJ95924.1 Mu DNA-binding protein [Volucribacter psittacicida]
MNSKMKNEWFSAFELEGLGKLPNKATNVTRKATKENWKKRQIQGKKGVAYEYHYTSLPLDVQQALGFDTTTTNTQNKQKSTDELEKEIKQVKESVNNLLAVLNPHSQTSLNGLNDDESRLISLFRLCNKQQQNSLISTAEDLVVRAINKQKESSEPLEDYKVA